jgi:hypothetical protein
MIVNESIRVLKNCEKDPAAFDQFVDEFREERDATELLELLCSKDDDLVRLSAWILSEIRASKYGGEEFKSQLAKLTRHSSPAIRLHSLNALFPFLSTNDQDAVKLIARLQADENEGVRMMADAAAERLKTVSG